MKAIVFLFVLVPCICNAQWVQINTGHSNYINDVYFINNLTGWTCDASGKIYKSTNGGINFVQVYSAGGSPSSIHFYDSQTGFAVGISTSCVKTTNGGTSWTILSPPAGGELNTVYVNDPLNIFAAGSYLTQQAMFFSPDAGSSWTRTYFGANNSGSIWGLCRSQFYFYASGTNGLILRSNGPTAWIVRLSNTTNHLWSIDFGDNNSGWAVGNSGTICKTTNLGDIWAIQNSGVSTTLYDVYFINANKGWIVGTSGLILHTSNGGTNWLMQQSGVAQDLANIYFTDSVTGWACGAGGTLLKTTNGGITFLTPISSEIPNQFSLSQNYPNPFNPATKIRFDIPSNVKGETSNVRMIIYDVLGREAAVLVNESLKPGTYEVEWNASNYPSGIYYYKLAVGDYNETKKMVLIK
jgi:photosystem II stability/assembly factor-like uncharacterized protein